MILAIRTTVLNLLIWMSGLGETRSRQRSLLWGPALTRRIESFYLSCKVEDVVYGTSGRVQGYQDEVVLGQESK